MTIWYPDVSNHNGAMTLAGGTVAVCAKVTEGTGYADPFYGHYKSEAARVGAVLFGYHFLRQGNGAAQARWCFQHTGPGVNVMVDCEPLKDNAGNYISKPSVQDGIDFAVEYRALGGLCSLNYLPRWYWQELGSPSLAGLAGARLGLVSSNYTAYSDTGPGWTGYGGGTVDVWQYTDRLPYSGQQVDFNAYRGTIEQFKTLLGIAPIPAPPAPPPILEEDMFYIISVTGAPEVYALSGGRLWHIADPADLTVWEKTPNVVKVTVSQAELANIKAA